MLDDQHIYLESESLFHQIREYFIGSFDEMEKKDSFQVDQLTFRYVSKNSQYHRANEEPDKGIFMDEVYETVARSRDQYDFILWMNRNNSLAPAANPEQDIDFWNLDQLKTIGLIVPRPSVAQCLDWWEEWTMPDNIRRHVTKVAEIAYKLAIWLRQAGMVVDPILTHRAGLVHDLDKIETLYQAGRHGHVSADFLVGQGYPELAEIIRSHLLGMFLSRDLSACSWEMKLVNYSDKLVEGDRVVLLPERLSALKQRYPHSRVLIDSAEPHLWRLDNRICSFLSLDDHEALVSKLID